MIDRRDIEAVKRLVQERGPDAIHYDSLFRELAEKVQELFTPFLSKVLSTAEFHTLSKLDKMTYNRLDTIIQEIEAARDEITVIIVAIEAFSRKHGLSDDLSEDVRTP